MLLETFIKLVKNKPIAKMGPDFIIWIPRDMIRSGQIDPSEKYEIFLKKKEDKAENTNVQKITKKRIQYWN